MYLQACSRFFRSESEYIWNHIIRSPKILNKIEYISKFRMFRDKLDSWTSPPKLFQTLLPSSPSRNVRVCALFLVILCRLHYPRSRSLFFHHSFCTWWHSSIDKCIVKVDKNDFVVLLSLIGRQIFANVLCCKIFLTKKVQNHVHSHFEQDNLI